MTVHCYFWWIYFYYLRISLSSRQHSRWKWPELYFCFQVVWRKRLLVGLQVMHCIATICCPVYKALSNRIGTISHHSQFYVHCHGTADRFTSLMEQLRRYWQKQRVAGGWKLLWWLQKPGAFSVKGLALWKRFATYRQLKYNCLAATVVRRKKH